MKTSTLLVVSMFVLSAALVYAAVPVEAYQPLAASAFTADLDLMGSCSGCPKPKPAPQPEPTGQCGSGCSKPKPAPEPAPDVMCGSSCDKPKPAPAPDPACGGSGCGKDKDKANTLG